MVDFTDFDASKAWFETQSPQSRSLISSRAALRVLANISLFEPEFFEGLALVSFRAVLISAVRGSGRTADMEAAARSADSAALSALSADSADSAALSALSMDAQQVPNGSRLGALWPAADIPPAIKDNHQAFLRMLAENPDWAFWRNWYLAMWDGTFEDWDLAHAVALIDDVVWKGEDALAKVAARIREIEAEHLKRKLPQVDEVFENDDALYDVRSVFVDPTELIASIFSRVTFAFENAVQSNSCDLNGTSLAAKILREAIENCRDDPNAAEQFFRQAAALIEKKISGGQFAEDDELDFLVSTLKETALQLRADHPDVAKASDSRINRRLREIDQQKALEIAHSIDELREGTAGRLSVEFALASETVRAVDVLEAQASALKRTGNHAARISLSEKAKKTEGSGIMSAIKIGLRADKVVELVTWLISGS